MPNLKVLVEGKSHRVEVSIYFLDYTQRTLYDSFYVVGNNLFVNGPSRADTFTDLKGRILDPDFAKKFATKEDMIEDLRSLVKGTENRVRAQPHQVATYNKLRLLLEREAIRIVKRKQALVASKQKASIKKAESDLLSAIKLLKVHKPEIIKEYFK